MAEREGFEPPVPLSTAVFKTAVIDHSTISPVLVSLKSGAKVMVFLELSKFSRDFLQERCIFSFFGLKWRVLAREKGKKNGFYFAFCALIRTFAP